MLYERILRPILFRCDPEWAHDQAIGWSAMAQKIPGFVRVSTSRHRVVDPRLNSNLAGIPLDNPIGLAAGYDKSGRAIEAMASLGFGHIEIGSVSASPSAGNPKPRLWRLPQDEATCVHYGLPNEGAAAVADHLTRQHVPVPLGINLVNTNRNACADLSGVDEILSDYEESAKMLQDFAAYLMLNLSCPNTTDGRAFFDDRNHLSGLLTRLESLPVKVPIFLKISPDADDAAIDRLLETVDSFHVVKGFMFNLSPRRRTGLATPRDVWSEWPGAISGKPTQSWMDACVARLYARMDRNRFQIIAAGGVASAEDACRKIRSGASAVQLLTSLIYHGPGVVKQINQGLLEQLDREGIGSITELIGADVDLRHPVPSLD